MSKFIKIGIPVIVVLGIGYGAGYYYANKLANEEAQKAITAIKSKSPQVETITYKSVNAGFLSLFTHSVYINDVNISLKQMPENSIHIDTIGIENIEIDSNKTPQSFEISYSGLSLNNANQIVQQYFDNKDNITGDAYQHLSNNDVTVEEHNQKVINDYVESIAEQYANAQLSGKIKYNKSNATLEIHSDIDVAGETAYAFNTTLGNYTIQDNPKGFINAFNEAKINEIDYTLHLNHFGNKDILAKGFPMYATTFEKASPDFFLNLKYTANNKDLIFDFNFKNKADIQNSQMDIDIHSNLLLHNVELSNYTLSQLNSGDIKKAFDQSYFGLTNNQVHFGANITAQEINGLPPQYQQLVKMTFGEKNLDLFFDVNEKTDYDNKGLGTESMSFGLRNMGDVTAYLDYNYTDKLYVKQVVDYIQKSIEQYNEAQTDEISQQSLTQESFESEMAFAKNIKINKAGLVINNQTLIQDLIKLYAAMTGQQPDQMKVMLSQQLAMFANQTKSDFSKGFFDSLANYINDPKKYEVTFIPKGTVTYNEILDNYFQAIEKLQKENQANTQVDQNSTKPNNQAQVTQPQQETGVDQYNAVQKAYENTLELFHYQFNVNGKKYQ